MILSPNRRRFKAAESPLCLCHADLLSFTEWINTSSSWRFLQIGKGAACFIVNNMPIRLAQGDMMVFSPANKAHLSNSAVGAVSIHYFVFHPEAFHPFLTLYELKHFLDCAKQSHYAQRHFPARHPHALAFAAIVVASATSCEIALRARCLHLVAKVFQVPMPTPRYQTGREPWTHSHIRFETLSKEMSALDLLNMPTKELARLCDCAPRTMRRVLETYFGLNILRIKQQFHSINHKHLPN